eukprot:UN19707
MARERQAARFAFVVSFKPLKLLLRLIFLNQQQTNKYSMFKPVFQHLKAIYLYTLQTKMRCPFSNAKNLQNLK